MEFNEFLELLNDSESDSLLAGKKLLELELAGRFISRNEIEENSTASFTKINRVKNLINFFVAGYGIEFDILEEIGFSKLDQVKKVANKFPDANVINSFLEQAASLSFTELQKEVRNYIKTNEVKEEPEISSEEFLVDQTKNRLAAEFMIPRSKIFLYLSFLISTKSSEDLQDWLEIIKKEEALFYEIEEEEEEVEQDNDSESLPEL